MIKSEETVDDFAFRSIRNRVAKALIGLVKIMTEIDVIPAKRSCDNLIQLNLQGSQTSDI